VDKPFKLLVIEREYSTPDIPTIWTRKVSLTTTEVKTLIDQYRKISLKLKVMRETLIAMGAEFTPFRQLLKISKNHYGVLTIMADGTESLHLTNHWSWVREDQDNDEFVISLFIPAVFLDEVMNRIVIKLSE